MIQLNQLLENENRDRIAQRLKVLGCLGTSAFKKGEAINAYTGFVSANAENIYQRLDEAGKLLVSEMAYGRLASYDRLKFVAKYNKSPIFEAQDDRYHHDRTLLGSLFFGYEKTFPEAFKELFKPFVVEPTSYQVDLIESLPEKTSEIETSLQSIKELQSILQSIECKPLKVSDKTSLPSTATVTLLNKLFSKGDYYQGVEVPYDKIGDIRAVGWVLLLQAGKLVKRVGTNIEITPKGKKALRQPPEMVLKGLWDHWVKNKLLDEFKRIHNIKGQTSKAMKRGFTSPITRRENIEEALKKLPIDVWTTIEDLSKFILLNDLDFEVTHTGGWGLYISDSQYGNLGGYHNTWYILEEPYLLCLLFEYAATLGIIDVGFVSPVDERMHHYSDTWGTEDLSFISRYDGLTHIKITALGAYILGRTSEFTMALPQTTLTFSNNAVVSVESCLMPIEVKETLDDFGEHISDNQWQLSEDSLASALQSGHKLSALKALLKSYNVISPAPVAKLFERFEQSSNKLKLKDMLFLYECENSVFADNIMQNKKTPYAMRAGVMLIAIPEKQKEKFQAEMLKQQVII
jgi:hypothetical protein